MSGIKDGYVNAIKAEIDSYFLSTDKKKGKLDLALFDLLDQRKWPTEQHEKETFVPESIEKLARLFGIPYTHKLQSEFVAFVKKIILGMCNIFTKLR